MAIIKFAGTDNFEMEVPDGTPLQDAIDAVGADIQFSCREGTCATCIIEVLEGNENLNTPTEAEEVTLLPDELEDDIRLACQCSILRGKVTIQKADM